MKRLFMLMTLLGSLLGGSVLAQQDVTLSLLTSDQLCIDFLSEFVKEWELQWPEYTITYDFQQNPDPETAVLTALAAGEPIPDLLGIEVAQFPRFMQNSIIAEHFVDLTDLLDDRGAFIEGRLIPYTYEGGLYGAETALSASAYYYQPAIFEENGVSVPTTWDEFLEVGAQLGERDIAMTAITDDPQGFFGMLFLQRGGVVFDENGAFVFGEEPNRQIALEVLDIMRRGIDSGAIFLTEDFWGATIPTAFRDGRLAGIVMPDWYSGCCLKPGAEDMAGQWSVAPMPVFADGQGHTTTVRGGTGFAVAKSSENVELAKDLVHDAFLTVEGQIERYEIIGFYPTMFDALEDPRVTSVTDPFYSDQAIGATFAEVALDTPGYYQSPNRPYFLQAVAATLPLFFDGTVSPEEFIDQVVQTTQDEIDFNQ